VDTYSNHISLSSYIPEKVQNDFINNCVVNSTANIFPEESGSATEVAMLKFINRCGINIKKTREDATIVQKMPFSSSRKRTSTISMISGNVKIYVKGASEIILDSCSHLQTFDGQKVSIDQKLRE